MKKGLMLINTSRGKLINTVDVLSPSRNGTWVTLALTYTQKRKIF